MCSWIWWILPRLKNWDQPVLFTRLLVAMLDFLYWKSCTSRLEKWLLKPWIKFIKFWLKKHQAWQKPKHVWIMRWSYANYEVNLLRSYQRENKELSWNHDMSSFLLVFSSASVLASFSSKAISKSPKKDIYFLSKIRMWQLEFSSTDVLQTWKSNATE